MVKNDAVARGLVGEVISRFERRGMRMVQCKTLVPSKELLEEHYVELKDKPFYAGMVKSMSSSEVVPMVWEGINAVKVARAIIGATNPQEAACGTIRGDFGVEVESNVVHGSDSPKSAEREIALWFPGDLPALTQFERVPRKE